MEMYAHLYVLTTASSSCESVWFADILHDTPYACTGQESLSMKCFDFVEKGQRSLSKWLHAMRESRTSGSVRLLCTCQQCKCTESTQLFLQIGPVLIWTRVRHASLRKYTSPRITSNDEERTTNVVSFWLLVSLTYTFLFAPTCELFRRFLVAPSFQWGMAALMPPDQTCATQV